MTNKNGDRVSNWYDQSYGTMGFKAQRLYPNEELLRCFGRNYFSEVAPAQRKAMHVLEIGCGSCANLWMVAAEGFTAHGLDSSSEAIELGKKMLQRWEVKAELKVGDMRELPYADKSMDCVFDIGSGNCMTSVNYEQVLKNVARVLKPGGLFFLYTPHIDSGAFTDHAPAELLDKWTLNGIKRKNSPFVGNDYAFRFESNEHMTELLKGLGFEVGYSEKVTKTYHGGKEKFSYVSLEARRK